MLPQQILHSFLPITSGIIVSLINKYIISSPKFDTCCKPEPEEVDSESDETIDSTTKEMSNSLGRTSAITATTSPSHPIHMHHFYNQHF